MPKKIAVFTGTRAEYGLLHKLILAIEQEESLELQLIVSGSHLSNRYGQTFFEIHADHIAPAALVQLSLDSSPQPSMSTLASEALLGTGEALEKLRPNLMVVLGDRYETFAAAASAHLHGIPICHLHGGESTLGALDDRLRHSITQLSSWHFTSAEPHQDRVKSMGHSPDHVFNVGPMVLDNLYSLPIVNRLEFETSTGYRFAEQNLLVTYHPETLLCDRGYSGFQAFLEALQDIPCNILFTHPNADAGSNMFIQLLDQFSERFSNRTWIIPSLGSRNYLSALRLFEAVAGNSSSGVIEAPLLNIPVVNVGDRQKGRYRYGYVLDVPADREAIAAGLRSALASGHQASWPRPYRKPVSRPSDFIIEWLRSCNNF